MEKLKLSDVATIIMGQSPNSDTYNENGDGMPFFQGKTDFGKLNPNARIYCNNPKIIAKSNDILISVRAPVGDVNISNTICCIGRGISAIRVTEKVHYKYIYYYLKTQKNKMNSLSTGSTFKAINKSVLENLELNIYTLEDQLKIVNILDKSQELIDKRKEQIEQLDELVKSRFIEMFGDTFLNTKNFEMKKIKDIATLVKGVTYKPEQVNENGMIVLRSSNIQNSKFDLKDIVRIYKEINEKFLVKENDILMCNRNGSERLVGKVAKIPMISEQMTFGTFMTIIRSPYFNYLFSFFQTEGFRRQIKMQTSVAINQISIPLLESVKVPLPPMELQNEFAEFTNQVDKLKFEMEKSLKELEDNFNSLMQKAFKGELF